MKRWLFWMLTILGILAFGSVLLSLGDDELYPEVTAVIAQPRTYPSVEDNGFYALVAGLDVAVDDQPSEVGLAIIDRYESSLADAVPGQNVVFDSYPNDKRIPMSSELVDLCDVKEEQCLDSYRQQSSGIAALVVEQNLLMTRYRALQHYPHFVTACTNSYFMPLPMLSPLPQWKPTGQIGLINRSLLVSQTTKPAIPARLIWVLIYATQTNCRPID